MLVYMAAIHKMLARIGNIERTLCTNALAVGVCMYSNSSVLALSLVLCKGRFHTEWFKIIRLCMDDKRL